MEVLLEFNESIHVSPALRYDLSLPDDNPFLPTPEQEIAPLVNDATLARTALKEAKDELASGNLSTSAYRQVEASIKRNKEFAPSTQYSSLIKIPHTSEASPVYENIALDHKLGYFTAEHETEYYLALDAKLGDEAAALQLQRIPDPPTFAERERDASIRNPASVYNWLRRNQPQTLQDHEVASEKSVSRPSNARTSKRAPAQRKDEDKDIYDDDGMDVEPTPKNKRKRDDDTGYRPKGGSSRPKKKKEEGTPSANRNGKKT